MGKSYRTANGKSVDIDNLRLVNEKTIAVGNMKVNARGDQLGPGGQILQGRNQALDQHYKLQTPIAQEYAVQKALHEQAKSGASVSQGRAVEHVPNVDPSGESFDPPETVEQPTMRGSLADSIAKQTTVTQELMTPPSPKANGPQRI